MARHLLILANEAVRARALHWVQKAPLGYRVWFAEPKRTTEQSDRMWAMLGDVARQCTINGKKYTSEQWKCIFLKALGHDVDFLPTLDGTSFFPTGFRSSDLSKREMMDMITSIQAYGDGEGIVFGDTIVEQAA